MRIAEASINLAASHQLKQEDQERESYQFWRGGQIQQQRESMRTTLAQSDMTMNMSDKGTGRGLVLESRNTKQQAVAVEISSQTRGLQPQMAVVGAGAGEIEEPLDDLRLNLFKLLIENLTGRKIEVMAPGDVQPPVGAVAMSASSDAMPQVDSGADPVGWGLAYDYYESYYEYESTSFSAQGIVKTADGKEISIDLQVNMSREFFQSQSISLRAGSVMQDPLVVNFAGGSAELTESKFSFDIDLDGRTDQISFVRPGSGFLVLDRNDDGQINDGSELFGPATGNGFAELAEFDEDRNGWIDEADSVFNRLRVWTKDSSGQDHLLALGQVGIGALYLGHIDTPFLLKDGANQDLGQVRSSGFALHESGRASVLQQVDLVV